MAAVAMVMVMEMAVTLVGQPTLFLWPQLQYSSHAIATIATPATKTTRKQPTSAAHAFSGHNYGSRRTLLPP
ncbi:hypothetical protein HanRHA438_Chr15g0724261 [Helianthus annuus]|nr:hypothetical protein HanRHA438_Chr15g0724261 [Helianthus annuus]